MTLNQARVFYLSLIAVFLAIIITSVYFMLGGFKEVVVQKAGPVSRTIVGRQFVSRYDSEEWVEFGRQCKQMVDNGDIDGVMTIITYHTDSLLEDQISKFVGITLSGEMAQIPQGFVVREMSSPERYQVKIDMHVLVQPRPHKVESMILEAAQTDGKTLRELFFELRYSDGTLQVEGWVE